MRSTLRTTLLASVIGLSLGTMPVAIGSDTHAARAAEQTYLIEFTEPGMVAHSRATRAGGNFVASSADAQMYKQELIQLQAEHKTAIAQALGLGVDELNVTHHYLATHSGIAAVLTAEQAQKIRGLPGVASVEAEVIEHLHTFRGPEFIGADTIWSGESTPTGTGTEGMGAVIGILDGGTYSNPISSHPSFANTAACGHSAANPKVRSALDCNTTNSSGECTGTNPHDAPDGHGSHTASTAGGNRVNVADSPGLAPFLPPGYTEVSGVAPCATLRTYKVCGATNCSSSAIQGGMNAVLLHGDVDVINFSISGGTSPWNDNDRRKLDLVEAGVFVAASAGNNSQQDPSVIGRVNHRGPWVMSVASSTHDENGYLVGEMTGPTFPIPNGADAVVLSPGSTSTPGFTAELPIRHFDGQPANAEGCTDSTPFPANYFAGAAAIMRRGTCPFTEKVENAFNAGAQIIIIGNNEPGGISMDTTGAPAVPHFSTSQLSGDAVVQYIGDNPGATMLFTADGGGDILSEFSYRGPTPAPLADLTKPDITAPGDSIIAAGPSPGKQWVEMGGTSMSGPHVAGSAALVRAANPDWTPMQVKSALMMTAKPNGTSDGGGAWNIDDVGSGRVELSRAALAGFVLDETIDNFLAANPSGGSMSVRDLNLAAVRDLSCSPSCTWTRTVTSTLQNTAAWTATFQHPEGMLVSVQPEQFNLAAGASQTLTFTATPQLGEEGTAIRFGRVLFNTALADQSPELSFTVAARGSYAPQAGIADLALAAIGLPDPAQNGGQLSYVASVANFGPDEAVDVVVDFDLPPGVSYSAVSSAHAHMIAPAFAQYPLGEMPAGMAWTCDSAGTSVSCTLASPMAANTVAPPLGIDVTVAVDATPTTITTTITASSIDTDPNPGNNSAEVQTEVTGPVDVIFQDGFEGQAGPSVTLDEGFDDVSTLPGDGWSLINNASAPGSTTWFQGSEAVFSSHEGDPTSYIGANFNNVTGSNTISTWLLTPEIQFNGESELSFWTRTSDQPASWADNLQVRVCTSMPCTDVGASPMDTGAYGTMVLEVNPGQTVTLYPGDWTQYTVTVADGLPTSGNGRIAFRYFVLQGGPEGTASNFIGIDTLSMTAAGFNAAAQGDWVTASAR